MAARRALYVAPQYDGQIADHLPGASQVEERLKAVLGSRGRYDLRCLRGRVTRPMMRRAINELVDTSGELLFYFYGHGVARVADGVFVTSEGEVDDEGVLMSEVVHTVFGSSAREAVLLIDCCHAGLALPTADPAVLSLLGSGASAGRAMIAGCAGHQKGWIGGDAEAALGVFSSHVLDGLEGRAKRERAPHVRAGDLALYVTDNFSAWNQSPVTIVRESGDRSCILTADFPTKDGAAVKAPPAERGLVLGIPFMPSQTFVGRDAELETLKRTLVDTTRAIAVSATVEGLGGVGKTELVIQLLQDPEVVDAFATTVWLDAAGPLAPQWEAVAWALGKPAKGLDQRALVQHVAAVLKRRGRTLLVLDNAADWHPADGLVPLDMAILVTTRTRGFGGAAFRHLELDVLSEDGAEQFLVTMVPRLANDSALPKLLQELDGHALALEIAGGTIDALDISAAEYLGRIENQQPSPRDVMGQIKHGRTVDECLNVTWLSLKRDSSRALWRRAALFAPTSAHRELLRVSFVGGGEARDEMRRFVMDSELDVTFPYFDDAEFDEAYAELRRRNVFSRIEGPTGERWAIHRLVRDFGRQRADASEFISHALAFSEWLRDATLDLQPELPHIVAAILDSAKYTSQYRDRRFSRELLHRSGGLLFDSGYMISFIQDQLDDPKALNLILQGLTDINEDVRRQAINLLERLAHIPEVIEGVAEALDDPNPAVRALASKTISEHGTDHVIAILTRTLQSSKSRAKIEAIKCLSRFRVDAEVLEPVLADTAIEVRFEAAIALAGMGNASGAPLLIELAGAKDPRVRARAVSALGRLPDGGDTVVAALGDSDQRVVEGALRGLLDCPNRHVVERAVTRYWGDFPKHKAGGDGDRLCLQLGNKSGIAPPRQVITDLLGRQYFYGKDAVVESLAFTDLEFARPFLSRLLDSGQSLPAAAIVAAQLGDTTAIPRLRKISTGKSQAHVKPEVLAALDKLQRLHAALDDPKADRLIRIGDLAASREKSDSAELIAFLADVEAEVRREAARTLGLRRILEAAEPLKASASSDPDPDVRLAAAIALLRIRCRHAAGTSGCSTATIAEGDGLYTPEDILTALEGREADQVCPAMVAAMLESLAEGPGWDKAGRFKHYIRQGLDSEVLETRLHAITALERVADSADGGVIMGRLGDENAQVRALAAQALGRLKHVGARQRLEEMADSDPDPSVREQAAQAVSVIPEVGPVRPRRWRR